VPAVAPGQFVQRGVCDAVLGDDLAGVRVGWPGQYGQQAQFDGDARWDRDDTAAAEPSLLRERLLCGQLRRGVRGRRGERFPMFESIVMVVAIVARRTGPWLVLIPWNKPAPSMASPATPMMTMFLRCQARMLSPALAIPAVRTRQPASRVA
jgi:hypothetical protein